MAPALVSTNPNNGKGYPGKLTWYVGVTCIIAAMGGLIFGYDIGISGGVTSMAPFLSKFFPSVYRKKVSNTSTNQYCKFDNFTLTSFTSSLYIAALAVPLYVSEMAPYRHRGSLNIVFQLAITIGNFVANLVNYLTPKIKGGQGWRVSLGGACVPAAFIFISACFLPNTPNSMLEKGQNEEARAMLRRVRGLSDKEVEEEFQDLVEASKVAKEVDRPWRTILKRQYRPHLTMSILIPFFQQLTATLVSIYGIDKWGRRFLFLEGGFQMFIFQILLAVFIGWKFGTSGEVGNLPKSYAITVVAFICLFVAGFAWSWGPLGWLVPSEIFPLEIRSAAQSITVAVNMLFTFLIAQLFLAMLCHMKFGLFIFFAVFVALMTLFIYLFLPETKNIPIEDMSQVWKQHWFWKRFLQEDQPQALQLV
ncbi:hypothetical protein GH714_013381 [Hevea brasiliensis]|uniref:Major facilitator superfamily (MFS) profile domain-containing protein n=1 Tax=Hevea brasiliensis TaxID=3981 RepID=A0A6A6KR84_HEVBR|nr:hypothetical protein GH714_013381 [Hevea brasiliensis]